MTRFQNLIFDINEIDVSVEHISHVLIIKIFHLYQQRNEWVNWDGDTGLVKRPWSKRFDLSLQETTDSAENQRVQGTKLIIDEVPAICAIGENYVFIATEFFTKNPFDQCDIHKIEQCQTLQDIKSNLNFKNIASAIYTGNHDNIKSLSLDEQFYSRESKSTGSNSYLGWALKPRNINLDKLQKCIEEIKL